MSLGQILILLIFLVAYCFFRRQEKEKQVEISSIIYKNKLKCLEQSGLYRIDYVTALAKCVSSNYQSCALTRPSDTTNHLLPEDKGVVFNNNYGILFIYRFQRSVSCPGGREVEYSTFPIEKMVQQLNQSLPNYCIQNGLYPLRIVYMEPDGDGHVLFEIAPFTTNNGVDWKKVDDYLTEVEGMY